MFPGTKKERKPKTKVSEEDKPDIVTASHPPNKLKAIEIIINTGKNTTAPKIFGKTKNESEFTPMISRASICSVTRIVPISEAILEPTLPAKIREMIVGENSRMVDDLVMKPIVYSGSQGVSMFDAVCNAITPPINVDNNTTIGIEFIPICSISSNIR